jgi:coenzyme F420-dependent glucose-6-phosphate dehydrogenase
MIEIKVSYDHDLEYARHACDYWAPLALSPEQKRDVHDPIELERLADAEPGIAQRRFIVSSDPDEVVEQIRPYVELGFDNLVFHAPGEDQHRFLDQFCRDVVPRLREQLS